MADEPVFELAASPGHLLHRAQQFAAERFAEAAGGVEITPRQFAVLSAVAAEEGLTQTQLVKVTGIDRSTLAELVARMAGRGLLIRERAPGDARANSVRFTDDGRALYAAAIEGAKAADEAILDALPKNKRANFLDSLLRIATKIETDEARLRDAAQRAREAAKKSAEKEKPKKTKKKKKKDKGKAKAKA